jgi:DNA-binding MarR family transcriptional regulator
MPPDEDVPVEQIGCCSLAMRKASRRLAQLYDSALAPSGLKSTQYSILMEVFNRAKSPPTMQELAAVLVMDRSTLGQNLRPLERDGYIELRQDTGDRRRRFVHLTAEGLAKCSEAKPYWSQAQERFKDVFGTQNASRLRATLIEIAYDERLSEVETRAAT